MQILDAHADRRVYSALRKTSKLGLPSPRLQLTWIDTPDLPHDRECIYSLVIPLKDYDCRSEVGGSEERCLEDHAIFGRTKVRGGIGCIHNGLVDTPYRDGVHAKWDAIKLRMHIYAVYGEEFRCVED